MKTIYEKLREARLKLGFSQDYVANCLGISISDVTQIELGNRKLYHLSDDYLLNTKNVDTNQAVFGSQFHRAYR